MESIIILKAISAGTSRMKNLSRLVLLQGMRFRKLKNKLIFNNQVNHNLQGVTNSLDRDPVSYSFDQQIDGSTCERLQESGACQVHCVFY